MLFIEGSTVVVEVFVFVTILQSVALRAKASSARELRSWAVWVVVIGLCLPLLWECGHQLHAGWFPQGDEAVIAAHAHDVLSAHPPLLGMRSTSSSTNPGVYAHHPGPMQFYLLAVPYALSGWGAWSLLVGSTLICCVLVAVSVRSAFRAAGGPGVLLAVAVIVAMLCLTDLQVVDPLNAWSPVLGLFAVLMLAWRLLLWQRKPLVWFAVCATYTAQAHLLFLPTVALIVVLVALVGVRRWQVTRDAWWPMPGHRTTRQVDQQWWRRRGWVTTGVLTLLWAPVLVDLVKTRPNNASQLFQLAGGQPGNSVGVAASTSHLFAAIVPLDRGAGLGNVDTANVLQMLVGLMIVTTVVWQARRAWWVIDDPGSKRDRIGVLAALTIVGLLPMWWEGAHLAQDQKIKLFYLDFLMALPLTAAVLTVWALCRWCRMRGFRLRPFRDAQAWVGLAAPLGVVALTAALVVGIVPINSLVAATTGPYLQHSVTARQITGQAQILVARVDAGDLPVIVQTRGFISFASLGPALSTALIASGHRVYFDTDWPKPQDDDWRRVRNAPQRALVVTIRDRPQNQPWPALPMPPTLATAAGSLPPVAGLPETYEIRVGLRT